MGSMMFNAEKHLQKSNEKRETCFHIFCVHQKPHRTTGKIYLVGWEFNYHDTPVGCQNNQYCQTNHMMVQYAISSCGDLHIVPENGLPKRKFIFQPLIFRGYVNFREGIQTMSLKKSYVFLSPRDQGHIFPPRLKRVKKGDDGEVPEEVQRECSLLKLVQLVFWGTGVDKQKKDGVWPGSIGSSHCVHRLGIQQCICMHLWMWHAGFLRTATCRLYHFRRVPCHILLEFRAVRLRKDIDHPFIMTQVNTFETKKSVHSSEWKSGLR